MVHGRPGPAPQTAKREQFARLIGRGVPNAEACRLVGINRRTGTRWRFGRSITGSSGRRLHYSAVINTRKREISPRYLSEDERVRIADLVRQVEPQRQLVTRIRRDRHTATSNTKPGTTVLFPYSFTRSGTSKTNCRRSSAQ
jgi:hypothetical protein